MSQGSVMPTRGTVTTEEAIQTNLRVLSALFGAGSKQVGVRLWNDILWPDEEPRPVTLALKHPGALRAMFLPGTEVGLAEAYLYDDVDIEGEMEQVFDLAESLVERAGDWRTRLRVARDLLRLPKEGTPRTARRGRARLRGQRHSIERDRAAIRYHYDVSNDFYSLWLDERMVYSCAYFCSDDDTLEVAQAHKLDYICRKLRLQPGQRLLDIGCGWGGLALWAAEHYGVDATGITLSERQAELANRRIAEAGLADRCRVELRDYREVPGEACYDALVSVGMFEHVGEALLTTYFSRARALLRPGGPFLNHGIAVRAGLPRPRGRGTTLNETYVFPDGELVPINATLRAAEEAGFEVRDVESLREHYARTLHHWVRRLEAHRDEALQCVDEVTYRVWRLFMAGSAHGFNSGRLNVYQSLLLKPDPSGPSGLPLTREDWYLE